MRHLSQSDNSAKESFEAAVRNSTVALGRLREICKEELEAINSKETSDTQFEDPNWSHKQAFLNGQRSKLRAILALTDFIDQR